MEQKCPGWNGIARTCRGLAPVFMLPCGQEQDFPTFDELATIRAVDSPDGAQPRRYITQTMRRATSSYIVPLMMKTTQGGYTLLA